MRVTAILPPHTVGVAIPSIQCGGSGTEADVKRIIEAHDRSLATVFMVCPVCRGDHYTVTKPTVEPCDD